jgi:hypothetical protein
MKPWIVFLMGLGALLTVRAAALSADPVAAAWDCRCDTCCEYLDITYNAGRE